MEMILQEQVTSNGSSIDGSSAEDKAKEIFGRSDVQTTTNGNVTQELIWDQRNIRMSILLPKQMNRSRNSGYFWRLQKFNCKQLIVFLVQDFSKVTYYMCIIKEASTKFRRVDQVIQVECKPSIAGGITCNKDERKLLSLERKLPSLTLKLVGLCILIFAESCRVEYKNSVKLTKGLCTKMINQIRQYEADNKSLVIRKESRSAIMERNQEQLQNIRFKLSDQQIRLNDLNQENDESAWLNKDYRLKIILGFNQCLVWLTAVQHP